MELVCIFRNYLETVHDPNLIEFCIFYVLYADAESKTRL